MRTDVMRMRRGMLAPALALALAGGLAQAQVTSAPPVAPVPPVQADPIPPVTPVPVTPPGQARPEAPAPAARAALPAAPPETTPPAAAAAQAAELERGEPLRWEQEDTTEEERLRTMRKEVAAAYEEAKIGCKRVVKSEREQCLKDARATYEKDLAAIKDGVNVR